MRPRNADDLHIVRLRMLRDVAVPFVQEVNQQGGLDFNVYMDDWKLKGCMLGWMAAMPAFQAEGWSILRGGFPVWRKPDGHCEIGFRAAAEYFGLTERESFDIFGVDNLRSSVHSRCPTLDDRIARVDGILRNRCRRFGQPAAEREEIPGDVGRSARDVEIA